MPISAIVFLLGFTVGCLLAFVRHPVYGLLTYIFTLYGDPSGQWWGHSLVPGIRWELIPALITLAAMLVYKRRAAASAFSSGVYRGFIVFVVWIIIQLLWALSTDAQEQLLTIWLKFLIVGFMICGCIDSWKHLRLVLWAHVLGCVYMGWVAYGLHHGGRFEGFGLGSVGDANTGALQLATGFLAAGSLFLSADWRVKAVLLPAMGLIANGLIATESRGGFLALAVAGVVFIILTPKLYRKRVLVASFIASICFFLLTNANYWTRVQTIEDAGAKVQGLDTGHARLVVLQAQWRMLKEHPFGCGHACTEILSPEFVPSEYLSVTGTRASHNTFMTMMVDHGIPGGLFYLALIIWVFRTLRRLTPQARSSVGFPSVLLPGFSGIMVAIVVGDLFGQYLLLEARVWFVTLLITYAHLLKFGGEIAREPLAASANLLGARPA